MDIRRFLVILGAALAAGCTRNHDPMPTCADTPSLCPDAGRPMDTDAGPPDFGTPDLGPPEEYVSARIEPLDAVIRCDATQAFHFFARRPDGSEVELLPTWTSATPSLGTVSIDGVFTPRAGCVASGRTHVTATAPDRRGGNVDASADVTVRIELDPVLSGVTAADGDAAFAHASGAGAASPVLYPLDGAVMPNNVLAPDIQWAGGVAGDLYRVTVQNASIAVVAYVAHTGTGFRFDWTPPADEWRYIAENYDSGVDVQVDRFAAATSTVVLGTPVHVRLTRSSISGAVYYWALTRPTGFGYFDRIQAGTGAHEHLIPHAPPGGDHCLGCHTVSRDGRYVAAMEDGGGGGEPGTAFDLTEDLSGNPAPSLFPPTPRQENFWFTSTFSPDSQRLFINSSYAILLDPHTGATVPATGLPPRDSANYFYGCEWAPDDSAIAMAHIDPALSWWGHKFSHSDLVLLPVTGPDAFGPLTTLHSGDDLVGAPEGGRTDNHPSWSPGSTYLAFQHGDWSRTTQGTADTWTSGYSSNALYVMSRDGVSVQRLDTAVAGTHGHRDFWPTFSPFVSHEPDGSTILWIAFTSGRHYGNAQAGTATAGDLYGRQLWVTALEVSGGEFPEHITADPSHVPYWLPGQDTTLENLGAYWSSLACRGPDADCTISSECCSGYCAPNAAGHLSCMTPPLDSCRAGGDSCGTDGDCCRGLACQGNACLPTLI